jgi:hypothetical protein
MQLGNEDVRDRRYEVPKDTGQLQGVQKQNICYSSSKFGSQ